MDLKQTIDIEVLLAPISGETPAGEDPRPTPEWGELKQARQSHGENDPFGETEVQPADWDKVIQLGQQMLTRKGKHLEVACDLTEALIRKHGFAGLRDGLRLVREIQTRFWESLYPELDTADEVALEESLLDRAGPLNGLNTNIVDAINAVPVTEASGVENFTWLLYNDSRYVENVGRKDPEARAQLIADGRADPEAVNVAIAATPWQFYEAGMQCLEEAGQELKQLDDLLDEKYAPLRDEGPTLGGIKQAIEECKEFFEATYKEKKPAEAAPVEETSAETAPAAAPAAGPLTLDPRDRADALRRLRAVAQFFQRTEPHSPVAYLVQRAAAWGEMSLEEWLREVVKDEATLGQIRETLGIKKQEGEGGSW